MTYTRMQVYLAYTRACAHDIYTYASVFGRDIHVCTCNSLNFKDSIRATPKMSSRVCLCACAYMYVYGCVCTCHGNEDFSFIVM